MRLLIAERGRKIGEGGLQPRLGVEQQKIRLLQIYLGEAHIQIGPQLGLIERGNLIGDDLTRRDGFLGDALKSFCFKGPKI